MAIELSVVSPTYNEAENVEALAGAIRQTLQNIEYELLIVDDDSPDLTWQRVEDISHRDARVRSLRRTGHRGLGAAVIEGFAAAQGTFVACIDADFQHDPGILPEMLHAMHQGATLVAGCRYMPGGGTRQWHWLRRMNSRLATQAARWLLGVALQDPLSGYFMLRREDFRRIQSRLNGEGFKILLEMVAQLPAQGIREVPYIFGPRRAGQSKLSHRIAWAYLKQLLRLWRQPSARGGSAR